MTDQLSTILAALGGALACAVVLLGVRWFSRSKTGQAIEAKAESFSFDELEKGLEWLADDTSDKNIIVAANARISRRRDDLARAHAKITAKLNA